MLVEKLKIRKLQNSQNVVHEKEVMFQNFYFTEVTKYPAFIKNNLDNSKNYRFSYNK